MNFSVPKDHLSTMDGLTVEITDEDANDVVGEVKFEKGVGRHIELLGRYKGTVQSHEECVAFVKGVQCVLEYIRD
jgi:predicted Zn-dependent protease with MMP-like domain